MFRGEWGDVFQLKYNDDLRPSPPEHQAIRAVLRDCVGSLDLAQKLAQCGGDLLTVQKPRGDGEGEVFPVLAIGRGLVAVQFEKNQAGTECDAFVSIDEGMVAAKIIQIRGSDLHSVR